ncbi:hypothetical protein FACS1894110_25610 [Spirochaetia bacterium]|nr:hypothetical protein FACS1894110_25610 [Spirochaetia bacterium]
MALQSVLSAQDTMDLQRLVTEHNGKINQGRNPQQNLGKDDFLKILIAQHSKAGGQCAPLVDKGVLVAVAAFHLA